MTQGIKHRAKFEVFLLKNTLRFNGLSIMPYANFKLKTLKCYFKKQTAFRIGFGYIFTF